MQNPNTMKIPPDITVHGLSGTTIALPAKNSVFSSHTSRIRSKALKHSTRATPTNQNKSPWNQPDCMVKASTFHLPLDLHVCDKNISWLDTGPERFQTLSVQFLRRISSGEVQTSTLRSNRCNGMPRMNSWSTSICFISSIFCKPCTLPPKLLTVGDRMPPLASHLDGKRAAKWAAKRTVLPSTVTTLSFQTRGKLRVHGKRRGFQANPRFQKITGFQLQSMFHTVREIPTCDFLFASSEPLGTNQESNFFWSKWKSSDFTSPRRSGMTPHQFGGILSLRLPRKQL